MGEGSRRVTLEYSVHVAGESVVVCKKASQASKRMRQPILLRKKIKIFFDFFPPLGNLLLSYYCINTYHNN